MNRAMRRGCWIALAGLNLWAQQGAVEQRTLPVSGSQFTHVFEKASVAAIELR